MFVAFKNFSFCMASEMIRVLSYIASDSICPSQVVDIAFM